MTTFKLVLIYFHLCRITSVNPSSSHLLSLFLSFFLFCGGLPACLPPSIRPSIHFAIRLIAGDICSNIGVPFRLRGIHATFVLAQTAAFNSSVLIRMLKRRHMRGRLQWWVEGRQGGGRRGEGRGGEVKRWFGHKSQVTNPSPNLINKKKGKKKKKSSI